MSHMLANKSDFFRATLVYLGIDVLSIPIPLVATLSNFQLALLAMNVVGNSRPKHHEVIPFKMSPEPIHSIHPHLLIPPTSKLPKIKISQTRAPSGRKLGRRNGSRWSKIAFRRRFSHASRYLGIKTTGRSSEIDFFSVTNIGEGPLFIWQNFSKGHASDRILYWTLW